MKVQFSNNDIIIIKLLLPFFCLRYLYHIFAFYRCRKYIPIERDLVNETREYGVSSYDKNNIISQIILLCWAFNYDPFFLTLFYARIKSRYKLLPLFKRDESSLYIYVGTIGKNIHLNHPFSTILNAKIIGDNFTVKNNVTIGNKNDNNSCKPTIGNNVYVSANVVIFGDIKIGNNVIVGAGSVVNKDVPDNCIVYGNPMKIIRKE